MRVGLLLLLLVVLAAPAAAFTADDVPSPRPEGWVVDLTGTLPIDTVTELNRLSDEVKVRTGAELAVVVIPTTGGADPHAFAARLLDAWGIGKAGKNNGVLVFTALDDQATEIILGGGLDGEDRGREIEAIVQGEMMPRFRGGNPVEAIRNGVQSCAARVLGVDFPMAAPAPEEVVLSSAAPVPAVQTETEGGGFLFPLVWGLLGTCVATLVTLFRPRRRARTRRRAVPVETGTVPLEC